MMDKCIRASCRAHSLGICTQLRLLSEQALDDSAGFLRGGLYRNKMPMCHEDA